MFDPVSLIVGALASGLLAGIQASAEEAVVDGYRALRDCLIERYGRRVEVSIRRLEAEPTSPHYREEVARELRNVGADRDPELTRLARQLLDLVENPEQAVRAPAAAPEDPVQQLRRATGLRATGQVLEDHVRRVMSIRSQFRVEDTDLLTANIARRRDLPESIRMNIEGLHRRMREIIEEVAARIEEERYQEVQQASSANFGLKQRERAVAVVQARSPLYFDV